MEHRQLPGILYRYFPLQPFIEQLLNGECLRFADPLSFNDPFEIRPSLYMNPNDPETQRYHHRIAKKRGMPLRQRMNKISEMLNRLRKSGGRDLQSDAVREQYRNRLGIVCLTPHRDSLLMWSHYGDSHKGICVGFDTSVHFFRTAMAVRYQDRYPEINPATDSQLMGLEKTILTKAACWDYEDEWRIVKHSWSQQELATQSLAYAHCGLKMEDIDILANHRGPGDYTFNKDAVREIVIGARTPASSVAQLKEWMRLHNNDGVKLFQAACHNNEYRLVLNPAN